MISDFQSRGLVVPETTTYENRLGPKTQRNPFAGDVVGNATLSKFYAEKGITQEEARQLLVLEANRQHGSPRPRNIERLLHWSFQETRSEIQSNIDALKS